MSAFVCFFVLQNKYLSTEHPVDVLEKRLIHTENERVRRDEMRQYFYALKKALNIEERVSMCKLDILNQVRTINCGLTVIVTIM